MYNVYNVIDVHVSNTYIMFLIKYIMYTMYTIKYRVNSFFVLVYFLFLFQYMFTMVLYIDFHIFRDVSIYFHIVLHSSI